MKRHIGFLIVLLFAASALLMARDWSNEFPRAKSLYAQGQKLIKEKNFPGAINLFQELADGFKNSEFRDIYNYSLGRAYYLNGNFDKAIEVLETFPNLFPNSDLRPYAYYLQGNCEYRRQHLEAAFILYSRAYRQADNKQLRRLASESLLSQVEAGYFPPDSILNEAPAELRCPLKAKMANLVVGILNEDEIDSLLGNCPRQSTTKAVISDQMDNRIVLGILLPLSGPYAQYGQSLLDGISLAIDSDQNDKKPVELVVYDTKADQLIAARQALALAEMKVDAVIGPLLSPVAITVAAVLSSYDIPLMVPAANQAGFTDLSPYAFQLSPNNVTVGKGMAQYAVEQRGMQKLAVITPTSLDEQTMADAFVDEAKRLGAEFLGIEKFRPGETDFGPYIGDIKEAILGAYDPDIAYITLQGDTLKPGEAPVSIDGIFVPATADQLYLILPQIDFYRVSCSYLGTSEWESDKVLKLGEKVTRDGVFYSSEGAMTNSAKYVDFSSAFDRKYGNQPDRLAALGYDAVNLLFGFYRTTQSAAADLVKYLTQSQGFTGASGDFIFGTQRTNLALPLFDIEGEQIKPLAPRPQKVNDSPNPSDSASTKYLKYDY